MITPTRGGSGEEPLMDTHLSRQRIEGNEILPPEHRPARAENVGNLSDGSGGRR